MYKSQIAFKTSLFALFIILCSCSNRLYFSYQSNYSSEQLEIQGNRYTKSTIDDHAGSVSEFSGFVIRKGNIFGIEEYGITEDSSCTPPRLVIDPANIIDTSYYILEDKKLFILQEKNPPNLYSLTVDTNKRVTIDGVTLYIDTMFFYEQYKIRGFNRRLHHIMKNPEWEVEYN
jgi:hypothetical protein